MLHVLGIQASYPLCLSFLYHKKFQIWPFIQFLDILSPGHLTSKSDVYSFGVVLLEILTGRRSMDKKRPSGQQNLVAWARQFLADKRKLDLLVDHRLERQYSIKGVQKVSQLAYNCLSKDPKTRPTMDEVVRVLTPLQDLNDLAILSCHSRLPQQGRRKKKDGTPQLTYNPSKSIRDSPLNTGRQHCRWWAVTSPWLAQLFDKTKVWMPTLSTGKLSEEYISSLYKFWVFETCQSSRVNGRGRYTSFLFLNPDLRELTINLEHSSRFACVVIELYLVIR